MRPEKLMINDWVSLFQGNPDGSSCNVQITFIGEYGDVGIEGCEEYTSANCNLLFPILLTSEILEKNGFEECHIKEIEYFGWRLNEDFSLELNDVDTLVWNDVAIHYVHQLQHALKLCKVDKEIKI